MTFFNKKEDVIKIELTPYGRKLLGTGKFKPTYYTFLDDDILYNTQNAGFSENSIDAQDRILKETPYLKPQTNYKGVESSINARNSIQRNLKDNNIIPERNEKLQYQIGTNNYNSDTNAGISATFLLGEISGAVATQYTGSGVAPIDIPQINCDIVYELSVANRFDPQPNKYGIIEDDFFSNVFKADGTYVHIEKGELLILLSEDGGFKEKENFSIEIYEMSEDDKIIKPLKFERENKNIIDGILFEDLEVQEAEELEITEDHAEYHLQFRVDDEISNDKICLGNKLLKSDNIYVDLDVECDDVEYGINVDLYQTSVSPEDLEDC